MIPSVYHSLLFFTANYMAVMLHFAKANPWKELVENDETKINPVYVNAYRINDILIHAQFARDLPLDKDQLTPVLGENVAAAMSQQIELSLMPLQKVYRLAICLRHITKYRILKSFGEIANMVKRAKLGLAGEIGSAVVGAAAVPSEAKQWENASKNAALVSNKEKAEELNKRLKTFDKKIAEVRVNMQKLSEAVMEAYPERKLKKENEQVKVKPGKETIERSKIHPFERCKEGRQLYIVFVNELANLDLNALRGEIGFKPVAGRANSLSDRKEFLKKFGSHKYITEYDTGKAQPFRAGLVDLMNFVQNANQIINLDENPIEAGNPDIECRNELADELRAAVYYRLNPAIQKLALELQRNHVMLGIMARESRKSFGRRKQPN
ncbi:hypothetical protein DdX_10486 [Ditylenchus destructor]|uniref:Uncharacterized protein n=1 Tax=Ditylenchus destructor TaxID=166010 RepID=A0AAD4R5H4_9BILA|nr:hypothetical protein DdX_10486 [Ditylenchus destructor]